MNPDLVVDVGNSRIKWGRCDGGRVVASASLAFDDAAAWEQQLHQWQATRPLAWAVAGVQPEKRDRLLAWLRQRGDSVRLLDDWQQLGLDVRLPAPERVGLDRLLNAVAARTRQRPGVPLVLVDAGSAVTVDALDPEGVFCGGAILPGLRLMAQALHQYTALLPLVEVGPVPPPMPGTSTTAAIEAGLFWGVVGGIERLIGQLAAHDRAPADILLTGGDAPRLRTVLGPPLVWWPEMTLEGIRLAAAR